MECTEVDVIDDSTYYNYCSYCKECDYMFSYFNAECKNYANCNGYKDICFLDEERRLDEAEQEIDDMGQLYYEMGVNDRVYMKLYCDGSLKIGMFADDQCTTYIGDKIDMYNTTGLSFTAEDIGSDYMTDECISCARKVSILSLIVFSKIDGCFLKFIFSIFCTEHQIFPWKWRLQQPQRR